MKKLKYKNTDYIKESFNEKHIFILVRHSGCTFCREALSQLSKNLKAIKKKSLKPIVVHMGNEKSSQKMKSDFGLDSVDFVEDPKKVFYKSFGARRGSLKEVIGPEVIKKGLVSGSLFKYGIGKIEGDSLQLGGVYLLDQGEPRLLHRPCSSADVENWDKVLSQV